jgi:hypothetical protein
MAQIQTRTIAATDQIMAVLRDNGAFMTTGEIMEAMGGQEGTPYIYQILKRQERFGLVEHMKVGQHKNGSVVWRSLVPAEEIPVIATLNTKRDSKETE